MDNTESSERVSALSELQSEAHPVVQLELKAESETELVDNLFEAGGWNETDRAVVSQALEIARTMHAQDIYKGQPYIYHPLRIANRIVRYMGIKDAETVAAALLHDVVEDHAAELVGPEASDDPREAQVQALDKLASLLGEGVADNVAAVTNSPDLQEGELSYEEKLAKYTAKVVQATSTFSGWAIKFSDWCENGLGIIHSELLMDGERISHFMRKYGGEVLDTFVDRYKQYSGQLSPEAANYVATQITLAFQRLILQLPHK
jgi:hypothetical protein